MKKKYITPASETISLHFESHVMDGSQQSIGISGPDDRMNEADYLSNRHGWNSSNWTATDEDK